MIFTPCFVFKALAILTGITDTDPTIGCHLFLMMTERTVISLRAAPSPPGWGVGYDSGLKKKKSHIPVFFLLLLLFCCLLLRIFLLIFF